jgi:hypothetical protein
MEERSRVYPLLQHTQRAHFAEPRPDNPQHFYGFLAGLPHLTPYLNFAAVRAVGHAGPQVEPSMLARPPFRLRCARAARLMACSPSGVPRGRGQPFRGDLGVMVADLETFQGRTEATRGDPRGVASCATMSRLESRRSTALSE